MNIYVGNLAYSVTEDDLHALFSEYGQVTSVSIITDRDTGDSKGFAFVEMAKQAETENAIKNINGNPLKGRNIKANLARPKGKSSKPRRNAW